MKCPSNFKYIQENGVEKCVFSTNNAYSVDLHGVTRDFEAEQTRFTTEITGLLERIRREAPVQDRLAAFEGPRGQEYQNIQSEYANYSSAGTVATAIQSVTKSLPKSRAPIITSQIQSEKKRIESSQPNMLVLQLAVIMTLLSLLVYVFVPIAYAHTIVFLLLSVGVAVGIFLKK